MRYKLSKIGIIILFSLLIIGAGIIPISSNTISSNIYIEGINIGGLTKDEAINKLKAELDSKLNSSYLELNSDDKTWVLKYSQIGASYNYEEAVNKAYIIRRTDRIFDRVSQLIFPHTAKDVITMPVVYDQNSIVGLIDRIAIESDKAALDASVKYSPNGFTYTEDSEGKTLDKASALSLIINKIDSLESGKLELPFVSVDAEIRKSDLMQVEDVLGQFETKFNAKDVDRVSNLSLATKSMTNVLIMPGEVFSLNQTVGPRLEKYGFKLAKVIVNNQLVQGIGGGICQVSSTLYNAVLLSNLKIIERRNHSLPSTYVGLGRDATISGDAIDFKFLNNTSYPILIYGQLKGDTLKYIIFGKNDFPNRSVKIVTEVISKTEPTISIIEDPALSAGTVIEEKTAYPAFVVKSYRKVLENGKEVYTEPLFTDKYPLVNGIKRVGTKVDQPQNETDLTLPVSGSGE